MLKKPNLIYTLIIVLASALITSSFLVLLPSEFGRNESSDYTSFYEPVARNILAGAGYTRDGISTETFYPPGYPLILAALFGISQTFSVSETIIINIFIVFTTAISVAFIYHLSRKVTAGKAALITSFILMCYPFLLWITKQPNSEIPFMFFLYAGCTIFFVSGNFDTKKKISYVVSGVFIGVSILIRPIAILFPLAMAFILVIFLSTTAYHKKLVVIGAFLIGVLLPIIPWESYVYAKTQQIVLISNNGSIALRGGLVFAVSDDSYKQPVAVPEDVRALMVEIRDHYEDFSSSEHVLTFFGSKIIETPIPVLKLLAIKAARSWYATDSQRYENYIALIQLPYIALIIFGSCLAWRRGGISRKICISIWLLTFCNWGMSIMVTSTLRYMLPMIALQFVNIAQIPYEILEKIKIAKLVTDFQSSSR